MAEIILFALVLSPLVLAYILRSNAALGFLALCTGFTAATYASGSTQHWLDHLSTSGQLLSDNAVNLLMIVLPIALTLLLTRKHIKRRRFYLQIVPALASGGLLAVSIAPLLSDWINVDVTSVNFWSQLEQRQAVIVGVGALVSLFLVWMTTSKHSSKRSKSSH